jgi:hypothetical protein
MPKLPITITAWIGIERYFLYYKNVVLFAMSSPLESDNPPKTKTGIFIRAEMDPKYSSNISYIMMYLVFATLDVGLVPIAYPTLRLRPT